ncbi:hypothetical protein TIFTF001_052532 [Ficus carica]|uniref:RNase H type-1 domain-containing protein n=1 Tax=Ficus carica TaxID=3494 RepID=A0AA88EI96_FICCA|nr:hypothetical protein TIFTF001_052527 [Ficus carica]GMN75064.1 hypothetical protein TIFTF001_052528 [Ficus carica]GMN75067.1 hypothetical protein TIFTF001_052531 [Ficus carica]GMN75068.1 hypothetical protein TIFTF001_052532 [Ficus carica]
MVDGWFWALTSNGDFSVKSAYCEDQKARFASIASPIPIAAWSKLWKAKIHPHHQLLWWRLILDALLLRAWLRRIFVVDDPFVSVLTNFVDFQDISDLFMAIFASLCIECIWKERNKIIHDKVKSPIDQIIREVRLMMESYSVAILPSPVGSTDLQRLWLPPPGRWIKCNVDAAVRSSFSVTAGIACDSEGAIVGVLLERTSLTEAKGALKNFSCWAVSVVPRSLNFFAHSAAAWPAISGVFGFFNY